MEEFDMYEATCAIDDCERPRRYKTTGLCGTHAERLRIHGSTEKPQPPLRGRARPDFQPLHPETCTVEDCERASFNRGWCKTHYLRWLDGGEASGPIKESESQAGRHCGSAGCDRSAKALGWCQRHYYQWRASGVAPVGPVAPVNQRHELVGYAAVHLRLKADQGPASSYPCVDCGKQARDWSYDNADPDELFDEGLFYSLDQDHYAPRCRSCHHCFDRGSLALGSCPPA